jgi:hypothetical protein
MTWPTTKEALGDTTQDGQKTPLSRVRNEARPTTVSEGLGAAVPTPTPPAPADFSRLIGSAKLYLKAQRTFSLPYARTDAEKGEAYLSWEDRKRLYDEAKRHLQEAVLDIGVVMWIANLDEERSDGRQEDRKSEEAQDGEVPRVRDDAPRREASQGHDGQEVGHEFLPHYPATETCRYPSLCHHVGKAGVCERKQDGHGPKADHPLDAHCTYGYGCPAPGPCHKQVLAGYGYETFCRLEPDQHPGG